MAQTSRLSLYCAVPSDEAGAYSLGLFLGRNSVPRPLHPILTARKVHLAFQHLKDPTSLSTAVQSSMLTTSYPIINKYQLALHPYFGNSVPKPFERF